MSNAVGELQKALDVSKEAELLSLPDEGPALDRRQRLMLDRARALYLKGRFEEAMEAFEAFDSEARAESSLMNMIDAAAGYARRRSSARA